MEIKKLLKLRKKIKKKKPFFRRQNWFKKKTVGKKWRMPKGKDSKLKKRLKPRGKVPSTGFGSPKLVRGLNSSGFKEIRVFTVKDLEKINPKKEAVLIGKTVGKKKRIEIIKKAEEKNIKISNFHL